MDKQVAFPVPFFHVSMLGIPQIDEIINCHRKVVVKIESISSIENYLHHSLSPLQFAEGQHGFGQSVFVGFGGDGGFANAQGLQRAVGSAANSGYFLPG